MSVIETYLITCNNCVNHLVYDARHFTPQDAMAHAITRRGWTVFHERTHCDNCPPLCPRCGTDMPDPACEWCGPGDDGPR